MQAEQHFYSASPPWPGQKSAHGECRWSRESSQLTQLGSKSMPVLTSCGLDIDAWFSLS